MTLKKLSEITGYSVSTLSKAFHQSKEIPQKTREVIFAKAKELGVYEKYAQEKREKRVVAILCPELVGEYYAHILHTLAEFVRARGAVAVFGVTDFSLEREEELVAYYQMRESTDGLIVVDGRTRAKKYASVPTVYLNGPYNNSYADVVRGDFDAGTLEAISTLRAYGHKRIAFLGEKLTTGKGKAYS